MIDITSYGLSCYLCENVWILACGKFPYEYPELA